MRSSKKPIYISFNLLRKILSSVNTNKQINTYARRSTVIPEMIGYTLGVYNGKKFVPVYLTENMVGHKLGEFSATRRFPMRKDSDKKKK